MLQLAKLKKTDYERQGKIILPHCGDGGEVLQLHVEGWAAEHNRGRCTGKESFSLSLKNNFSFKTKQKMNNKDKYLH